MSKKTFSDEEVRSLSNNKYVKRLAINLLHIPMNLKFIL